MFDRVMDSVRRDRVDPAREYRAIVTWCAGRRPHPDWHELAELPVDADIQALDGSLVDLLENETPPGEVTGYWFGLCNPVTAENLPSADLYASGNIYSAGDHDWPCSPRWFPERRHACSDLLHRLYRIAYREGGLESIHNRAFDRLDRDQAAVVREATARLAARFEDLGRKLDDKIQNGLFDRAGVKRIKASRQFRAEFFEASRQARAKLGDKLVPRPLQDRVMQLLADYRAEHDGN